MLAPLESRRACVGDVRLLLSAHGQRAAAAAGAAFDLWVPEEMLEILRAPRSHAESPERLVPRVYCASLRRFDSAAEERLVREELRLWSRSPDDDVTAPQLYHFGDRADESLVPRDLEPGLRARFQQLRQGLDTLMVGAGYDLPRSAILSGCFRDAVALAAVLQPRGGFLLTRLERDGEDQPALCDYLDAWGLGRIREISARGGAAARPLRRACERTGLAVLSWAAMPLVAVHVMVPRYPMLGGADRDQDTGAVATLWRDAEIYWHRLF